uniref:Uncharacterized protein n=2 Tax=Nelumbo nucifera TaxID=4432 RepID=A0A822YRK4_NELNU|nr:TPA_asm: hypothetical protein HUJ06_005912 [Nelumbo nucifera]
MAKLFCSFFFVLLPFRFLKLSSFSFVFASMVPSSDAALCRAVGNGNDCDLASCRQWCTQEYNGNGLCSGSGFNPLRCVCIYNCN